MARTITVKGVGHVSAKPDYVLISMSLTAKARNYPEAMKKAADQLDQLSRSLASAGFERESLKTTDLDVDTKYKQVKDAYDNYHRVFDGFVCSHSLKVEFDFDSDKLAKALAAIGESQAQPEFSISFTIKEPGGVRDELLRNATLNAKEKAEVLCQAAGVSLGDLLRLDYNWGEISLTSSTDYKMAHQVLYEAAAPPYMEIQPDDINVRDTVTFVWAIE